jgi:hypothetical protein
MSSILLWKPSVMPLLRLKRHMATIGSERLTGALLDRLTHHVHILEVKSDSFRLKTGRKKKNSRTHSPPWPPQGAPDFGIGFRSQVGGT